MIYRIKESFNRDFDEAFTKKEQEMMKIRDKNRRINKILTDLEQLNDLVSDPDLSPLEKPEKNFVVDDSEVCCALYFVLVNFVEYVRVIHLEYVKLAGNLYSIH